MISNNVSSRRNIDISLLATSPDSDIQFGQYNTDEWKEFLYNYAQRKFNPMITPKKLNSLRRNKTRLEDNCEQLPEENNKEVDVALVSKEHFKTSISMISLLNTTHQWFKAEDGMGCSETTREISFCHVILQENGEPFILCCCPLRTDDGGTICVIDREPRDSFSKKDLYTPLPDVSSNNLRSRFCCASSFTRLYYQNSLPPLPTLFPDYVHSDEERVYLSNFVVELRTSLHGILESCELMEESKLNEVQAEFVKRLWNFFNKSDDVLLMIDVEPRDARWWVMAEDGALKQL
ncbi:hypothetical protein C1646_752441 [Rhizophagus diaphanus]|nr:hypothetical protein C1646_752441 [Rhizophagus diaphanus] [Rhizophagus sp. MUCL 43196]